MAANRKTNEIFDVNVYTYAIFFSIIFFACFFLFTRYEAHILVHYLLSWVLKTYVYELNFIQTHEILLKIINILHLNYFIDKFYYYFQSYSVGEGYSLISYINTVLMTGEAPETAKSFSILKACMLGNLYINVFNTIIVSPLIVFYLFYIKKVPERFITNLKRKQYKKEENKIINNLHKFNNDTDVDLYIVLRKDKLASVKDIENYLLDIIKFNIDINIFYNLYIKLNKNLLAIDNVIKKITDYGEKEQIFPFNLYKEKYSPYIYINNNSNDKFRYNLYPYWIFLFFKAKLVRNFPQAIVAKKLGEYLKSPVLVTVCKYSTAKNIPDSVAPYYFYYNLILNKDINNLLFKILDKKYYNILKKDIIEQ